MVTTVPSAEDIFQAFTHAPKPIQTITVSTLLDLHQDLVVNARKTQRCPKGCADFPKRAESPTID